MYLTTRMNRSAIQMASPYGYLWNVRSFPVRTCDTSSYSLRNYVRWLKQSKNVSQHLLSIKISFKNSRFLHFFQFLHTSYYWKRSSLHISNILTSMIFRNHKMFKKKSKKFHDMELTVHFVFYIACIVRVRFSGKGSIIFCKSQPVNFGFVSDLYRSVTCRINNKQCSYAQKPANFNKKGVSLNGKEFRWNETSGDQSRYE